MATKECAAATPRYAVQMYRARNDANGNPRGWWIMRELLPGGDSPCRCLWCGESTTACGRWRLGDVVDAEERGYAWSNTMPDWMRRADVLDLGTVDVDADGLRQAKELAANVWAPFAIVDEDRDMVWRWCWSRSAARRERDALARVFSPRVFSMEERFTPRRTVTD